MLQNQAPTKKKQALLKIIIIGESGVGKTALLHKYVTGKFIIEEHKATIGADFFSKEITINNKSVKLQIWDTAGQERFQSLCNAFYRGSDACVIVYDITDEKSYAHIDFWREKFLAQADIKNGNEFPFLLLGNKNDRYNDRVIQEYDARHYADDNCMVFYETSALEGTNVEAAIVKIVENACEKDSVPMLCPNLISVLKDYNEDDYIDYIDDHDDHELSERSGCCILL